MFKYKDFMKMFYKILFVLSIIGLLLNIFYKGESLSIVIYIIYIMYYVVNRKKHWNIFWLQILEPIIILSFIEYFFINFSSNIMGNIVPISNNRVTMIYNIIVNTIMLIYSNSLIQRYIKKTNKFYLAEIILEIIIVVLLLIVMIFFDVFRLAALVAIIFLVIAIRSSIIKYKKIKK